MFLAVTVLLTLLEISFSRRNPRHRPKRPRPRLGRHFKGGRTGRNDPSLHDIYEYLEGYSYEEPNGSDGDSYGESNSVECDEKEYDCENYSYEIVEPPPGPATTTLRPAFTLRLTTTRRPTPAPTPAPSVECDEQEYDCGNSGELPSIIVEPPRPATTKRPSTTRRPAPTPAPATTRRPAPTPPPAPTPAPCQRPWIRLATGCYRFQIKSPSPFTF